MKRALAVVSGLLSGILLAGFLAPMLISALPVRLRGASMLWAMLAGGAGAGAALFWWISGRRRM